MQAYLLVLRLVHILSGVFWAGAAFFLAWYLGPTAQATGPESGKVMTHLIARTRFITAVIISATLVGLTGILLYVRSSGNFNAVWIGTPTGLALTIGGIFGLAAVGHGATVVGPTNIKLGKLGVEIAQGGGPPTPEQAAQLGKLQAKSARHGRILAYLLLIAIIGMAINEAV